eukprot:403367244
MLRQGLRKKKDRKNKNRNHYILCYCLKYFRTDKAETEHKNCYSKKYIFKKAFKDQETKTQTSAFFKYQYHVRTGKSTDAQLSKIKNQCLRKFLKQFEQLISGCLDEYFVIESDKIEEAIEDEDAKWFVKLIIVDALYYTNLYYTSRVDEYNNYLKSFTEKSRNVVLNKYVEQQIEYNRLRNLYFYNQDRTKLVKDGLKELHQQELNRFDWFTRSRISIVLSGLLIDTKDMITAYDIRQEGDQLKGYLINTLMKNKHQFVICEFRRVDFNYDKNAMQSLKTLGFKRRNQKAFSSWRAQSCLKAFEQIIGNKNATQKERKFCIEQLEKIKEWFVETIGVNGFNVTYVNVLKLRAQASQERNQKQQNLFDARRIAELLQQAKLIESIKDVLKKIDSEITQWPGYTKYAIENLESEAEKQIDRKQQVEDQSEKQVEVIENPEYQDLDEMEKYKVVIFENIREAPPSFDINQNLLSNIQSYKRLNSPNLYLENEDGEEEQKYLNQNLQNAIQQNIILMQQQSKPNKDILYDSENDFTYSQNQESIIFINSPRKQIKNSNQFLENRYPNVYKQNKL